MITPRNNTELRLALLGGRFVQIFRDTVTSREVIEVHEYFAFIKEKMIS